MVVRTAEVVLGKLAADSTARQAAAGEWTQENLQPTPALLRGNAPCHQEHRREPVRHTGSPPRELGLCVTEEELSASE